MLPLNPVPLQPVNTSPAQADNRPLVATILRVDNDQAVLAMAGIQVVARLTSPEQAAWLAGQRTALFVPHWLNGQTLALQWVGTPAGGSPLTQAAVQVAPDMLGEVLRVLGEPSSAPQQQLAAALLANHLPLTSENLDALAAGLAHLQAWGAPEADVAARLLAQGLTPSPGAIDAALAQGPPVTEALAQLNNALGVLLAQHAGDPAGKLLSQVQAELSRLGVDWTAPPAQMSTQVGAAIAQMGRSLENTLAQQAGALPAAPGPVPGAAAGPEPSILLHLALLRSGLSQSIGDAAAPLAHAIDQFLTAARREQLGNAHADAPNAGVANAPSSAPRATASSTPAAERWLGVSFPLAQSSAGPDWSGAHLRVAYQPPEGPGERIDLRHTRLVLNLEVEGQPVAVDLSIAGSHVGAHVTLPTPELRDRAEQELPGLSAGLAKLGFTLQAAHCTTGGAPSTADGAVTATLSRYA